LPLQKVNQAVIWMVASKENKTKTFFLELRWLEAKEKVTNV